MDSGTILNANKKKGLIDECLSMLLEDDREEAGLSDEKVVEETSPIKE